MDAETARSRFEVSSIMRHNRICLCVNCGFKDHFIVGVRQLRAPAEVDFDRVHEFREILQQFVHDGLWKAVLRAPQNLLIFKK